MNASKPKLQVYGNRWDGELLPQAPTVVLFSNDKKESYFGFEAEKRYAKLTENNRNENWRYFQRFKMDLHRQKKLTRTTTVNDAQGREMPAVEVFTTAIRHLKNHFLEQAQKRVELKENEVRWVITVPAIWNDDAKQFMIEAAKMAGIKEDQISLAYEPEAAAIFCKQSRLAKLKHEGKDATIQPFPPGFKFLILDLGGGTVDITAHEVQKDGTLQTLTEPSGGKWGGTLVDDGFIEIFEGLFGKEVMKSLKTDPKKADYKRELDAEIEIKKKTVVVESNNTTDDDFISIKLPFALTEETKSPQFQSALEGQTFNGKVIQKGDKVQIHNSIVISAFDSSVKKIVAHLKMLLKTAELKRLNAVVMVGGFSESKVVQKAVKDVLKNSPAIDLIIPEDSSLASVQGAVSYGFDPTIISTRISSYSYGITSSVPFNSQLHPEVSRVKRSDGSYRCDDVFKLFVKKGCKVIPGHTTASHEFNPSPSTREHQKIEVYKSDKDEPPLLINECQKVGNLRINLPYSDFTGTTVTVNMKFGGTQMIVTAVVKGPSGIESVEASFDWL
ncbi:heat shock 70 kDa protein 12A-like [Mya arenaria]|uniref:heat shock 70 kDa protein 12A-like n=1 Tax=Mya arenaria TaxID=6604 RepID=UPI0022E280EC|nr:heat shock 70 kDa protein 12A-like [Mya arenaria]